MPESQFSAVRNNEALSALVDGEASELELRRLLKESEVDPDLRNSWRSYQLIGAALRDDLPVGHYSDTSSSIFAAIENEPALNVATGEGVKSKLSMLWSSLGRVAIAASVAGAVVVGVQSYQSPISPDSVVASSSLSAPSGLPAGYGAPAIAARTVSAPGYVSPAVERQVSFVPRQGQSVEQNVQLQAYLNHLMLEHAEHAALNASRGMMPFARVAELDTRDRFEGEGALVKP